MKPQPSVSVSSAEVGKALRVAAVLVDRNEYGPALRILRAIYERDDVSPPDGLSLYGRCLAFAEKKVRLAIDLCRRAIDLQPYEPRHWVHLVEIVLATSTRKRAVETLEEAVRMFPDEPALAAIRTRIGYRRRNAVPLLRREHPLNAALGRLMRRR